MASVIHTPSARRSTELDHPRRSALDGLIAGVSYAVAFALGIAAIVGLAVVAHEAVLVYLAVSFVAMVWVAFATRREDRRRS